MDEIFCRDRAPGASAIRQERWLPIPPEGCYHRLPAVTLRIYGMGTQKSLCPFFYCASLRNAEVITVAVFDGL